MDNSKLVEKIKELCKEKGINQKKLLEDLGLSKSTIWNMTIKQSAPKYEVLQKIEKYFELPDNTLAVLPFQEVPSDLVTIDYLATVPAGFDKIADIEGAERVTVPKAYLKGYPANECKMVSVKGMSMFPNFVEGDKLIFHLQPSVDSGSYAIVQYNGEEYTLKRVIYKYGENWLRLEAINPTFPPKTIRDAELEDCRVLGLVIYLIREI